MLDGVRHRATGLIALFVWLLAFGATTLHSHDEHGPACEDQAPCSLCIVSHHAPAQIEAPTPLAILPERQSLVVTWVPSAPQTTRCDRHLARAPPSSF